MHSYLKSIGFSNIITQSELENLIKNSLVSVDEKKTSNNTDSIQNIEYIKYFSDGIGLIIRGEQDEQGAFHYSHVAPFIRGTKVGCEKQEVYINKKVDSNSFTGMCDDSRLGISLIFYIQNVADFYKYREENPNVCRGKVYLAALAREGKVLLPTHQRIESLVTKAYDEQVKSKLINDAKNGDKEAMELLTMNDIDKYAIISERIKHEDLFSIVETSFIPFGSESDVYSVLCNIETAREQYNSETGERIWNLGCYCNGIHFDICINSNDLLGVPLPGMRFRGTVWMQGYVDYWAS